MLAFHRVPNVVTDLTAVVIALSGNNEQVSYKIFAILVMCETNLHIVNCK